MAIVIDKNPQKHDAKNLKVYKTYHFSYKDPVLESVRVIIARSQMTWAQISLKSGVSYGTLHNWFDGETRRPQFASIMAVVHACGKSVKDLEIHQTKAPLKVRVVYRK